MGLTKYIKTAFLNRWNLLALSASCAFALISGYAGVFLPLIAGLELAYVGFVGTHPKFQRFVDIQNAQASRAVSSDSSRQMLTRIKESLPRDSLERFESLRQQCLELRQIANELKQPGKGPVDATFDDFQIVGLDRLLWIYLRMLYTQFALGRFLKKTSQEQIQQDIDQTADRLKKLPAGDDVQQQRMRKALEDNQNTSRERLVNLQKAKDNFALVKLEIERLENKIRSLSEMAVNRQEPEYISGQVDQVASSMVETERTMNDLQFVTGLTSHDDEAPELLRPRVAQ